MITMIGFVNVNKPSGLGSSKVVSILKKYFNVKKIGHMGTLDPMAEGVLPIAIGKATRMFDYSLDKEKTYIAQFTFGATTNTLDADGEIAEITNKIPTLLEIEKALPSFFGKINQIPPQFSAKKVNGKCAYDFARNGEMVDLKPKEIEIYDIKLLNQINDRIFEFEIVCSGGTYIRSICRDLANILNSKAYMNKLIRVKSGKFDINNALTIEEIKEESLKDIIVDIEDVFDFEVINLTDKLTKDLLDGKNIKVDNLNGQYFIKCDKILIGIGVVKDNILKLKTYLREEND